MKSYKNKKEIREMLINHYNSGKATATHHAGCPVCGESLRLNTKGVICLHHMLHDKPGNRSAYRLFIHSPANLMPYHAACQGPEDKYFISTLTAELYQTVLEQYKAMCRESGEAWQAILIELEKTPKCIELEYRPEFDYFTFILTLNEIYQTIKKRSIS